MPLIEVRELLVLNVVVDLKALNTSLVHQILHNRSDNLLVNLVYTKWGVGHITILGSPQASVDVVLHA